VQQDNLLKVRKLVLVGCRDSDDLSSGRKVLGDAAGIAAVLVESDKLRNFVVLVDQVDRQSRIVVQRVCRAVLSTQAFASLSHHYHYHNMIPALLQLLAVTQLLKWGPCQNFWVGQSYRSD